MGACCSKGGNDANIGTGRVKLNLSHVDVDALEEQIPRLIEGQVLEKHGHTGKPRRKKFTVSEDRQFLSWGSKKKGKGNVLYFSDVLEVRRGQNTDVFKRHPTEESKKPLSFSVIYGLTSMNIVCDDKETFDLWFNGIQLLTQQAWNNVDNDPIRAYLQKEWRKTDSDGDDQLSKKEIKSLFHRINLQVDKKGLDMHFKQADADESGHLDFHEFLEMYRRLCFRPEIAALFDRVAGNKFQMAKETLMAFLVEEQKMVGVTPDFVRRVIHDFNIGNESPNHLSKDGFISFMLSHSNHIFDPEKDRVYQDMTQPLSHYFIASSHNTYLTGDQLRSASSVHMYRVSLRMGCRCVELDCWDGPDGEPIIYHGFTLTSKIKFRDVCETIKEHAFEESPFPVTLSLEIHTGLEQQRKMARHMVEVFGDMLEPSPVGKKWDFLPSPKDLQYKILVKGKTTTPAGYVDEMDPELVGLLRRQEEEAEERLEEEEFMDEKEREEKMLQKKHTSAASSSADSEEDQLKKDLDLVTEEKKKGKKVPKIDEELSSIVYLKAIHFDNFQARIENGLAYEMSSFSETKTNKLLKKQPLDFIEYNKRMFSRIYPMGVRFDSSNYDPQPAWNCGCQFVALNYQTRDKHMWLNEGKFLDNGKCGYVLKPEFFRMPGAQFDPNMSVHPSGRNMKLFVEIISASQLTKPRRSDTGEVIDPFVEVEVVGLRADTSRRATSVIDNNGFNPVWNESFEFEICCPELACLRIIVKDKDLVSKNDLIAQYCVPLNCIRAGYRTVPLIDPNHQKHELSSLFIRVHFDNPPSLPMHQGVRSIVEQEASTSRAGSSS